MAAVQDQFNWTMTYRRDSDIIHRYPYGALVSRKTLRKTYGKSKPNLNAARRSIGRKKKLVAWITSTCPTAVRRENYVRELAKFIQVTALPRHGPRPQTFTAVDVEADDKSMKPSAQPLIRRR